MISGGGGGGGVGGGGDTLIFSSYVGLVPASTVYPQNIRNIKHPKTLL